MLQTRAVFIGLLWIAAFFAGGLPQAAAQQSSSDLNAEGIKRFDAGQYAQAVDLFQRALQRAPGEPALKTNLVRALNGWAVNLADRNDFSGAIAKLTEARKQDPGAAVITANLSVIRINYATREINEGRLESAEELLAAAAATADADGLEQIEERRASLYLMRGRQRRAAGNLAAAQEDLERSLRSQPLFIPALLELADLLYRKGEDAEALACYESAYSQDPSVKGLSEIIEKLKREAAVEGDFKQRSNRYFTVSYDGEVNEQAAGKVLSILFLAYREVGRELEAFPKEKLPVVLYSRDQFRDVTVTPDWSGAVYDGKIRAPVGVENAGRAEDQRLRRALYHEYTHALIHQLTPDANVPIWLNEGLASRFELDRREGRERYAEDQKILAELLRADKLPMLASLPHEFLGISDEAEAAQAYRISRTFVEYLATVYGPTNLRKTLEELNKTNDIDAALQKTYRRTQTELEEQWRKGLAR